MKKNRKVIVLLLVVIVSMFLSGCNLTLGYTTIPETSNDYPSIICTDEYISIMSPHEATILFKYTIEVDGVPLMFRKSVNMSKNETITFPIELLFDNVEDTDSLVITSATIVSSQYISPLTISFYAGVIIVILLLLLLIG